LRLVSGLKVPRERGDSGDLPGDRVQRESWRKRGEVRECIRSDAAGGDESLAVGHADLAGQQQTNERARERNARVTAEVMDLKEGLEMVEDKARSELGMLKPDEVLVQVSRPR
jgi:hypothetical protein